jgi:hypothetical protein
MTMYEEATMNIEEKTITITVGQFMRTAVMVARMCATEKEIDLISYLAALTNVLFDLEDESDEEGKVENDV